ncbi:MAG: hypothetical protein RLZZ519_1579, partial [Bacteroidota bacterium]|jgi:hypothetical protein
LFLWGGGGGAGAPPRRKIVKGNDPFVTILHPLRGNAKRFISHF